MGVAEYRVKRRWYQRQTYCPGEKQLNRKEYMRILNAVRRKPKLQLILQTLCATGIRVSELRYFTVESVVAGEISVCCKSKTRTILIPVQLRRQILHYTEQLGLTSGPVFRGCSGEPMNRSSI